MNLALAMEENITPLNSLVDQIVDEMIEKN
jgi:hypothetical protein